MGIVQVAGVLDAKDADTLLQNGVDWVGIPLRLPVHREDVDDSTAAQIASHLPDGHTVVITYLTDPADIEQLCRSIGVWRVQLHGDVDRQRLQQLKRRSPHLFVIKSLIVAAGVTPDALCAQAAALEPYVDMFITDTHDPATGACGATGLVHDWSISRALVNSSQRPVILAGGLRPSNVAAAIRTVKPAGVDAHTGVEGPDGRNSPELVHAFVREAAQAYAEISPFTA
ncbi:phosphoribosylanthranilate isomerase [Streptomyces sp. NPDC015127]|uniref:phosphoribosylanthranilate isomerase n=1 Tax=Streptomyces sp. NPDC015127 TaxID=3364939 RepID=UPI0036FD896B